MSNLLQPIKKMLIATLVVPLCLSLTACNDDDHKSTNNQTNNGKTPVMDCAPTK